MNAPGLPSTPERRHDDVPVFVLGNYRPSVTVVRALVQRGRRVVVGRDPDRRHSEGSGGVELSRHRSEVWDHPSVRDAPEAFLDALLAELARRGGRSHLLPLDQESLLLLARERGRLPDGVSLAAPATDTIATCLDKASCLSAAEKAGLPVPEWRVVRDHAELRDIAGRGPVVIKPLWPHERLPNDLKAIRCLDAEDLARLLPQWPDGHDRVLVQRLLRGARHNLYFAARDGELLDVVEVVCDRTDRLDGTGLAVAGRTCPVTPQLRDQLAAIAGYLRYTGVGFIQFLVEPGRPDGFIELNPRMSGSYVIADRAGMDMANLAVDLGSGLPIEAPPAAARRTITWAWTFGDLVGLRYAIDRGQLTRAGALRELAAIGRAAVCADVHLSWSWRDPLPTLVTYWCYLLRPGLRRIARRVRRARPPALADRPTATGQGSASTCSAHREGTTP